MQSAFITLCKEGYAWPFPLFIPGCVMRFRPPLISRLFVQSARGVLLADDLVRSAPLLNTLIGQDYRGLIRRAGVMFSFHESCQRGDLPFKTIIRRIHRGHWHLLEISSGLERAQICRTSEADAFPEDTPVKQDERLFNQFDLFEELPPVETLLRRIPRLYVWLTFGVDRVSNLTHVCWAAPAKREEQWLAFENILRRAAEGGAPVMPPASRTPDPRSKLRFREHVEEAIEKKNGDKSSA
jgi:hypothetical protein